jgi:hypothetical protein
MLTLTIHGDKIETNTYYETGELQCQEFVSTTRIVCREYDKNGYLIQQNSFIRVYPISNKGSSEGEKLYDGEQIYNNGDHHIRVFYDRGKRVCNPLNKI